MSDPRWSRILIRAALILFAVSLLCPAVIDWNPVGEGQSIAVRLTGCECLGYAFILGVWSPPVFASALSSLLIPASYGLWKWPWSEQPLRWPAALFLAAFLFNGRYVFGGFNALLLGYWLWLASFLLIGVAFLVRPAHPELASEPLPHVTESSATAIEYGDSNFRENN